MPVSQVNPGEKLSVFPYNDGAAGQVPVATGAGGTTFQDLPSAGESTWEEITGAAIQSTRTFTVPVDYQNYAALYPGTPVKILDTNTDGVYKIGIVTTHNAVTGLVTIAGPALKADVSTVNELYAGVNTVAKCAQVNIHLPGSWDTASSTLIEDIAKQFLRWHRGRAYLVRVDTKTDVQDTGAAQPTINVTVGGNEVLTTDLTTGTSWVSSAVNVDINEYGVDYQDAIEIKVVTQGTNQDSSDLTVSLTFVLETDEIPYEPASPDPWVEMTIGPISGTWCGLGEGVHTLVPTTYTKSSTGTTLGERWQFVSGAQKLDLQASFYVSYGSSWWRFNYTTNNTVAFSSSASPAPNGKVLDRLFQTGFVQNGVSFTWTRGGSLWGW